MHVSAYGEDIYIYIYVALSPVPFVYNYICHMITPKILSVKTKDKHV